jgi:membrane associated rhomboid family serine protease
MQTGQKRAYQLIPPYGENAALQLVAASGTTLIIYHFTRVMMMIMGTSEAETLSSLVPAVSLSDIDGISARWWTLFSYGWVHTEFWGWITNMIWCYCFGAVLQSLAGFRQVIPLYVYGLTVGGLFYWLAQLLPVDVLRSDHLYFAGAHAGIMSLAFAALTLVPGYKVTIAPGFRIPLFILVILYVLLSCIVFVPGRFLVIVLCLGGALTGVLYAMLLKNGFQPGAWVYSLFSRLSTIAAPDEQKPAFSRHSKRDEVLRSNYKPRHGISQKAIDDILDKINSRGYDALTAEEKDILLKAGKNTE